MQFIALIICLTILIYPARADLLQAGIQHTEYLPQMPVQLQAGSTYQSESKQTTTVKWYPLPTWLRGVYQSDFITNEVVQVYSAAAPRRQGAGKMKHIESFGLQLDNQGRLWNADLLPKVSKWEGVQEEIQTTVEKQCVTSNESNLVMHIHNYCIYLDAKKKRIVYAEQVDGFKTIMLQNKQGDLSIYDDIEEYDSNGRPLDRYIARSTMRRTKAFSPKNFENGIDLRQSLAEYLASSGHSDLIPEKKAMRASEDAPTTPNENFSPPYGGVSPNGDPNSNFSPAFNTPNLNSNPNPNVNPSQAIPSTKPGDTDVGF